MGDNIRHGGPGAGAFLEGPPAEDCYLLDMLFCAAGPYRVGIQAAAGSQRTLCHPVSTSTRMA
eukprot:4984629-Prorocentrum_lima.AAC.1